MSKRWKKMVALGLAAVLCMLPACGKTNTSGPAGTEGGSVAEENQGAGGNEGISEDSPYKDKGFDLSKHEDVVMYAIGDRAGRHGYGTGEAERRISGAVA